MDKVLVIGLDGATWDLIDEYIEKGYLKNISRLKHEGQYSRMRSSFPPTTYPAWKCYSTGKNPGKLGVFGMFEPDIKKKKIQVPSSLSFRSREIWDILGENGKRVGVINMPTTEPVKEVNGFMVGGPFSSGNQYTYPSALKYQIEKKYSYRTFMEELVMTGKEKNTLKEVKRVISTRFQLARDQIQKGDLDFLHMTIFHVDTLQHFYWGTHELLSVWEYIDSEIGKMAGDTDEDWTIIMISDHGFGKTHFKVMINNWLIEKGFLQIELKNKKKLSSMGIDRKKIYGIMKKLKLVKLLKKVLGLSKMRKMARSIPTIVGTLELEGLERSINWETLKAINNNYGITLKGNELEKRNLSEQLIDQLKNMDGPDGRKVFRDIVPSKEIYWGKYSKDAPDLCLFPNDGYEVKSTLTLDGDLFSDERGSTLGNHRSEGIFLFHNRKGLKCENKDRISILDVAPTILDIMNLEIPNSLDGSSLLKKVS